MTVHRDGPGNLLCNPNAMCPYLRLRFSTRTFQTGVGPCPACREERLTSAGETALPRHIALSTPRALWGRKGVLFPHSFQGCVISGVARGVAQGPRGGPHPAVLFLAGAPAALPDADGGQQQSHTAARHNARGPCRPPAPGRLPPSHILL
eukprot:gene16738-biopygen18818